MSVLAPLQEHNLQVEVNGDRLSVYPASKLNDNLRAYIREHKPEILRELTAEIAKRTLYVVHVDNVSFIYVDLTGEPLSHIRRRMRQKFGPSRVKSVEPKGDGPLTGTVCDTPNCRLCREDREAET